MQITARTDVIEQPIVRESNSELAWMLWDQAIQQFDKPIPDAYKPIDWSVKNDLHRS